MRSAVIGDGFRRLWWGESVSLTGSQITLLAVPLTAVVSLHASPAMVGVLVACRWAPFVACSLPFGVLVDRRRRRPILIAADLLQAVALAAVPVLWWQGALSFGALVAASAVAGVGACAFEIAYRAYLPSLVAPERLTAANARLSVSESAAEIAGPGLGGVLVRLLGGPLTLLADVISFAGSALALWSIGEREPRPAPRPIASGGWRRELGEGIALNWSDRRLRAFGAEAATYNFFWQGAQAILTVYAIRTLRMTASGYGLAVGIGSAGALLGAAVTGPAARRLGLGSTIVSASTFGALVPLLIPAIALRGAAATVALGAVLFAQGIGLTACNVHVTALRQTIVPSSLLGRVNAAYRTVVTGVVPLGALAAGELAQALGTRTALLVLCAGVTLAAPWLALSPVRRLRDATDIEPAPG